MRRSFLVIQWLILLALWLVIYPLSSSAQSHFKQWSAAVITGSIANNSNIKYYLESQLRLIDNDDIFNQFFILTGLGYQLKPTLTFFTGPGLIVSLNQGKVVQEYRLWQQLNWQAVNAPRVAVINRTRLEEKIRLDQVGLLLQLRQRFWLRIPINSYHQWFYSSFEEVFLNLNHPVWASPRVFEQNRAFIGVAKQLSKKMFIDFGYLNQAQFGPLHQIHHVLLLSMTATL